MYFFSMYQYVTSMYMYAVRCTCMQYDVHMCKISNGMNAVRYCSIYIFVISMYIYTVQCLYVEFRCMCVRFDKFVRNRTP